MYAPLAYDAYVAPARLRPQVWRLILGVCVVLAIYLGWMALMGLALWAGMGLDNLERALAQVGLGRSPWSLVALLFTFVGMALGTFAAVRLVHKRAIATLFGPRDLMIRDFVMGAGVLFAFSVPSAALMFLLVDVTPGLNFGTWLLFVPLILLGLLIQTGAEELVFRAYLQQQLAARFLSRWVWMVLPSILFGLVHYAPAEMGPSTWGIVLATGFFGLLLADLTARSGSIGMAWGLHFANNVMAMLFFTTGEALDGVALFRLPFGPEDFGIMGWMLLLDVAVMALVWGICRRMLRAR
jgi:uncharacterized protein